MTVYDEIINQQTCSSADIYKYFKPIKNLSGDTVILGSGGFGSVILMKPTPTARKELPVDLPDRVAVKSINVRFDRDIQRYIDEITILRKADVPNIPKFYGCFESRTLSGSMLYIVMGLSEGTNLFTLLRDQHRPLTFEQRTIILQKIALTVDRLHKLYIVHRDLKLDNIMVKYDTTEVMLIDFGISCYHKRDVPEVGTCHGIAGTEGYMDPEYKQVMSGHRQELSFEELKATDWWSFGQIVYNLYNNDQLYDGSDFSYQQMTLSNEYWVPRNLYPVMNRLTNPKLKPLDRPKADEILKAFGIESQLTSIIKSQRATKNSLLETAIGSLQERYDVPMDTSLDINYYYDMDTDDEDS